MPTNIFNYTGDVQTFIVPDGVYSIQSTLIGATGGNSIYSTGGKSIKISADIIVTPGTIIYIYIGGKGIDSTSNISIDRNLEGGFNGGGTGGRDNKIRQIANGAGGGGATDIRIGGTKLSNRIIVAGGGGGAGFVGNGGMASEDGKQSNSDFSIGGSCGTQTSGGIITNTRGSFNGILGTGGDATFSNAHGSGGGGGGYYGGAAGSSVEDHPNGYSAGGGGGSSYINKSYIKLGTDNISNDTVMSTNGSVTFSYIIKPILNEHIINTDSEIVDIKEKNGPIIVSTTLNLSCSQVTIIFDKNVSKKLDRYAPLTNDCFNLLITGGISTLNSSIPINITKLDKKYILDFLLIGIPNGDEILQVNPVLNSIYDINGNVSLSTQTNNTVLLDVPKITKVRISNNNSTITVIFNSTVFNTNKGTGILKTNNFSLSIHGGTAVLNNTTPTKISVSGNIYTLGINIKGIPNGLEELTVNPSSNTSIYNIYGVPALVNQNNNSIHLYKKD